MLLLDNEPTYWDITTRQTVNKKRRKSPSPTRNYKRKNGSLDSNILPTKISQFIDLTEDNIIKVELENETDMVHSPSKKKETNEYRLMAIKNEPSREEVTNGQQMMAINYEPKSSPGPSKDLFSPRTISTNEILEYFDKLDPNNQQNLIHLLLNR